jgi:hypothetical protein
MLGSQLRIFFILIPFKQLLSDKIFLGQEKNSKIEPYVIKHYIKERY